MDSFLETPRTVARRVAVFSLETLTPPGVPPTVSQMRTTLDVLLILAGGLAAYWTYVP